MALGGRPTFFAKVCAEVKAARLGFVLGPVSPWRRNYADPPAHRGCLTAL